MPKFQAMIVELNRKFSPEEIEETARHISDFEPGRRLVDVFSRSPLQRMFGAYLEKVPSLFTETLRNIMLHALSTTPPTPVTFAWAPGYDFEVTIWQAPDTEETRGGITVLIKSRYPDDKHPIARGASN